MSVENGRLARIVQANGYIAVELNGKRYQAHRLAWLYVTGEWPPGGMDHDNGDRGDNRFANLRLATQSENSANRMLNSNNTTGVKGVHWDKQRRKWAVQITVNRRKIRLGLFTDIGEAAVAYERAAHKYFGAFARPVRYTGPGKKPTLDLKEQGFVD